MIFNKYVLSKYGRDSNSHNCSIKHDQKEVKAYSTEGFQKIHFTHSRDPAAVLSGNSGRVSYTPGGVAICITEDSSSWTDTLIKSCRNAVPLSGLLSLVPLQADSLQSPAHTAQPPQRKSLAF